MNSVTPTSLRHTRLLGEDLRDHLLPTMHETGTMISHAIEPPKVLVKDEAMEPSATSPATDTGDSSTSLTDNFSVHDGAALQDLPGNEPKLLAPGCVVRIGANKRNTTGKVAAFIGTPIAMHWTRKYQIDVSVLEDILRRGPSLSSVVEAIDREAAKVACTVHGSAANHHRILTFDLESRSQFQDEIARNPWPRCKASSRTKAPLRPPRPPKHHFPACISQSLEYLFPYEED